MLQNDIRESIKDAMKAKDEVRLMVLRGLTAAFTNELVATNRKPTVPLPDEDALNVIRRMVKQRKDSIEQFRKGGREDLASREEAEQKILETYLPQMMSREEIEPIVKLKIAEMQADKSKAGILMGAVMSELKDKADGKIVKDVVESLLS